MKATTKASCVGLVVGLGAVALLAPSLASGGARTSTGSGAAPAAVARPFIAQLTGASEVPGPGDPAGEGAAAVTIDPVSGEICVDLRATGIQTAVAAHIHRGGPTVAGPIVVPLTPPTPTSAACVTATGVLAAEIAANPAGFYVNVHTATYPAGAIRGQLAPAGTKSGTTQVLDVPLRAYDSRTTPEGVLPPLTTRVVSLANGLDSASVSQVAVPPGAIGAILRITVADAVAAGFLKVYSTALETAPATSNVNWYQTGAIVGADATVAVDAQSKIKVTSGGQSSNFVIDVVGYIF